MNTRLTLSEHIRLIDAITERFAREGGRKPEEGGDGQQPDAHVLIER